jgi:hypothetical protein
VEEQWKQILDWPNYAVSDRGRIKRLTTRNSGVAGAILSQFLVSGYPSVNLTDSGKRKSVRVHRLVAEAFLPKQAGATEVNHIDASRSNNDLLNLEWVSASGNRKHGYDHGANAAEGERNGYSKLTEDNVRVIRATRPLTKSVQAELADQFGVSMATVRDVAARRTWAHI